MFLSATWPGPCIAATLSFIMLAYKQPGSFVLPLGFNEKYTVRESPAQPRFCFLEFQLCMVNWSLKIISEKSQRWTTYRFYITPILSNMLKPRRASQDLTHVAQRLPPARHSAAAVVTSLTAVTVLISRPPRCHLWAAPVHEQRLEKECAGVRAICGVRHPLQSRDVCSTDKGELHVSKAGNVFIPSKLCPPKGELPFIWEFTMLSQFLYFE